MKFIRVMLAASLIIGLGACTHVEPWQRGTLARPDMASEPAPLQQQVRRHIYGSREAAGLASGGSGGGCGCY
jgi:hypothetical protein